MKKFITKIMDADEAKAFIANMRWFAGHGRVSAKKLSSGKYAVRASRSAWSMWVED